jgi:uncharacterized membrane protein
MLTILIKKYKKSMGTLNIIISSHYISYIFYYVYNFSFQDRMDCKHLASDILDLAKRHHCSLEASFVVGDIQLGKGQRQAVGMVLAVDRAIQH